MPLVANENCAPPVAVLVTTFSMTGTGCPTVSKPIEIEAHAVERSGVDVEQMSGGHVAPVKPAALDDLAGDARLGLHAQRAVVPLRDVAVAAVEDLPARQELRPAVRGFIGRERRPAIGAGLRPR